MSTILYGNLQAEIINDAGARIQRISIRQGAVDLLHPRRQAALQKPLMLGREWEAADALAAIEDGRPAGFHAACGYGKTTLLRYIAATAAERGLAPCYINLRAAGDRMGDLLQDLVAELYVSDRPVKLTPQECAQLLSQVSAVVAVDDLHARPDQLDYLLEVLSGCSIVIGSAHRITGRSGSSRRLDGLPEEAALALVAGNLGRPLAAEEVGAVRRLATAVDGQPLHLRQCAALAREGRHSLPSLARQAAHDPEILDRLSINALGQHERRALAVLALTAGALLPAAVVEATGQIAYIAQQLESLHRRGLAEQSDDRFGLPVCKAQSYRQMLFNDLQLAASARGLSSWLALADPTATESQSAAEAALSMMEFAAERGDWTTIVRLARSAERVLFIAGRWEAWHHTLSQGLDAARTSGDRAAEAFFTHQQGTLAFCQDQLDDARQLLQRALTMRTQIRDDDGASITRHNLRLLELPDVPPWRRPRVPRRALRTLGGVLGTLALVVGVVVTTGLIPNGHPADSQPTVRPSTSATHATVSASSVSASSVAGSSVSASSSSRPATSATSPSQPAGSSPLQLAPSALPAVIAGAQDSQQITAAGGTPPYTFAVTAGTLPPGLTLSAAGALSGNPTTLGSYTFTIRATDSSAIPDQGSASYTLQVMQVKLALTLSPAILPAVTAGAQDSQQITAAGGTPPYTFAVTAGTLPPGLALSAAGALSGTPTTAGSYKFTITATDSSATPGKGSAPYTLLVAPGIITITLAPDALPDGIPCTSYDQTITASGGTAPYSFSVSSGSLPPGLSLSPAGVFSGSPEITPKGNGQSYSFTIQATDSSATPASGSQAYTLNVVKGIGTCIL